MCVASKIPEYYGGGFRFVHFFFFLDTPFFVFLVGFFTFIHSFIAVGLAGQSAGELMFLLFAACFMQVIFV